MPVHDWTRVDAGLFHNFHQGWTVALHNALNTGGVPPDYYALAEQSSLGQTSGAPALQLSPAAEQLESAIIYAGRANSLTVHHDHGKVVAVIEVISPGNKAGRAEFRALVDKLAALLRWGVHLLVIDLFPPGLYDPRGIHQAIWGRFHETDVEPPDKPLLLAAYHAGPPPTAYVDPVAVGDVLTLMPLFLGPEFYAPAPLEETYQATWNSFPAQLKGLLEGPSAEP